MKKTINVKICDMCANRIEAEAVARFGGCFDHGWLHLDIMNGSSQLSELCKKWNYDFCSKACLTEWLKT